MKLLKSNRSIVIAAVAMAAMLMAAPGTVAAQPAPSTAADSDISSGATVKITTANESTTNWLNITADNTTTIDSADVDITHATRNTTHYTASDASSEYLYQADAVDTNGDGTNDADKHAWEISNDEFADVPAEINENVTLNVTVDLTNSSGSTGTHQFQFTLSNGDQRSVIYLDQNSPALESQTDDPGYSVPFSDRTIEGFGYLADGQNTEVRDIRSINGSNTTVHVYLADEAAADHFSSKFGDSSAGDWDRDAIAKVDDAGAPMFNSELAGPLSDLGYGAAVTYDDSGDTPALVYEFGEEYNGETDVEVEAKSHPGFWEKRDAYGWDAISFGFGVVSMSSGLIVSRRRFWD